MKTIKLDVSRLNNRENTCAYANELLQLNWKITNLDALYDALSEVSERVTFVFTRDDLQEISKSPYAYKVFALLMKSAEQNPYIKIHFQ